MFQTFHSAILQAQYEALVRRAAEEQWTNVSLQRQDVQIYATIDTHAPAPAKYLCRIDMTNYPVDPYWIGFINPDLPRPDWNNAPDTDPRFWPWSPMPGLHGSFNLTFGGPFRTFWCRACTVPFFYYHGDRPWVPHEWPLSRVVSRLREALGRAEPPTRWRPMQQQVLLALAAQRQIALPADAGVGDK
jgi:hypothetical protein